MTGRTAIAATRQSGSAARTPVGELSRHVSLTTELALTQFKLKYTGSVLGYAWSLLKPFFLFGINYVVFIYVLKVGGKEFGVQLLLGIVVWTFFAEATSSATVSIAGNGHLIRKARFPRVVLVIASTLTALFTLVINVSLVIIVTAAIGHMHLGLRSVAAIPLLVELYLISLGIGLLLASVYVFFRDVGHLWEITSQVLFFGSCIVFPFSLLENGRVLPHLVGANPLAQIIEDLRRALVIDDPSVPWMVSVDGWLYVVPLAIAVGLAWLGLWVFGRLSPRFAESL